MTTKKRYYWLGKEQPSSQDAFFLEALDSELWQQGDQDNWDACWQTNMPEQHTFEQLDSTKTVNHIPGNNALTIKSDLYSTLFNAQKRLGKSQQAERYRFFPETFSMPEDYIKFQQAAAANPSWKWIQKPKNSSRGRGIKILEHPPCAPLGEDWMVQRYLPNPHLYKGHKYVLRCYGLITSLEPLRCYWFKEGSMKLASDQYQYDNFDNPYSYLTNPDINEENTNADTDEPVIFIPFSDYREWLRDEGIDDNIIFKKVEELIALTMIAARETMRAQSNIITTDTSGCYELIGFDCMIDDTLNPWILECNLSPSLDICTEDGGGGQAETRTKRKLVKDIVSIMQLNQKDIESHHSKLSLREQALEEQKRAGDFQCIFPANGANNYLNCFPIPRYADIISLPDAINMDTQQLELSPADSTSITFNDSLTLFTKHISEGRPELIIPNEIATWIWIKNAEGNTTQAIIDDLIELLPNNTTLSKESYYASIASQVWDMLADWSYNGLFTKTEALDNVAAIKQVQYAELANKIFKLCFIGHELDNYFRSFFKLTNENESADSNGEIYSINILPSKNGYLITDDNQIIAENCTLAEIIPVLIDFATALLNDKQSIAIAASILQVADKNIMVVGDEKLLDSFTFFASQKSQAKLIANRALLTIDGVDKSGHLTCIKLPLHLPTDDYFNCYPSSEKAHWTIAGDPLATYWLRNTEKREPIDNIVIESILFVATSSNPEPDTNAYQLTNMSQSEGFFYLSKASTFTKKDDVVTSVHALAQWMADRPAKQLIISATQNPLLNSIQLEEILNHL